ALAVLEGLRGLLVGDRLALFLADLLVADRTLVLLVDVVEVELVLGDRAVDAHGHVDEPEADRAAPERSRHTLFLPEPDAQKRQVLTRAGCWSRFRRAT